MSELQTLIGHTILECRMATDFSTIAFHVNGDVYFIFKSVAGSGGYPAKVETWSNESSLTGALVVGVTEVYSEIPNDMKEFPSDPTLTSLPCWTVTMTFGGVKPPPPFTFQYRNSAWGYWGGYMDLASKAAATTQFQSMVTIQPVTVLKPTSTTTTTTTK